MYSVILLNWSESQLYLRQIYLRETSLFALMVRKELFCVKDFCNTALLSFDKPSIVLSANQTRWPIAIETFKFTTIFAP